MKLAFLLIFCLWYATLHAQLVKIDSIPTTGLLLQQSWKFHAGGNPDWTKLDFDDTIWLNLHSVMGTMVNRIF